MKTCLPLLALALLAGCGGNAAEEDKKPEATALVQTAPATLGSATDSLTIYGATEAGPGAARAIGSGRATSSRPRATSRGAAPRSRSASPVGTAFSGGRPAVS